MLYLKTFQDVLPLVILGGPLLFLLTSVQSWFQPGLMPRWVKRAASISSLVSIFLAACSGFFVFNVGLLESPLWGVSGMGFSIRLDPLNFLIFFMITIIGFVVIRFSHNYLDGDAAQGRFIGRLAVTLASVQLLVLSGNLWLLLISWVFTSISLHRLLVFYPERPGAIVAARKKFIVARLADTCLLIAFGILYFQFGTGNLETIFKQLQLLQGADDVPLRLEAAAVFITLAAFLKSAQFPLHGWLIEVMETPTPVSALLHAGLLNAGPFLIVRMAHLMEVSHYAPVLMIVVGGFTALFAATAYLTQTSIKTSLGYSSVAHMGFSLLVCGLGAYSVALLHLVAHSFYKAHAFLSSGSIIEVMRVSKIKRSPSTVRSLTVMVSTMLALGLFYSMALMWGINLAEDLAILLVGVIIVMGLSTLFSTALNTREHTIVLLFRTAGMASIISVLFFTLESSARHILESQVPKSNEISLLAIVLFVILLTAFGATVILQIMAPTLSSRHFYRRLAIHLRNGFYANAIFDRMIGAWRVTGEKKYPI